MDLKNPSISGTISKAGLIPATKDFSPSSYVAITSGLRLYYKFGGIDVELSGSMSSTGRRQAVAGYLLALLDFLACPWLVPLPASYFI